ncbi:MAG: ABC transporter substrate-binding protein [Gammaproteobacteria bacterium]|nr:ABC transporter substrate-binding protein [Gammaproteobacteria bacterium]
MEDSSSEPAGPTGSAFGPRPRSELPPAQPRRRIRSFACRLPGLLAAGLLYAASASATPGVTEDAIVFGQSAGLSGPNEWLGIHYRAGILAAFGESNSQGGVDGRRLELIALDDRYEPEHAAANAERFVAENDVLAVVGGVGTPTAARIAPVLRTAGIPFIGHVTGADFLHDAGRFPNVVNLRASYLDEVRTLVEHIVAESGHRRTRAMAADGARMGIIYQDDAFGRSVMRSYLKALAEHGIPLLAKTAYSRNTHAVHASLFGLAKADLDAILLVGTYSANGEIINLANSLGHDYTMANLSFAVSYELRRIVEAPSDRILVTEVVPSPHDPDSALAASFRSAMDSFPTPGGAAVNELSLEGYLLGRYLVSTLTRMDGIYTRESFMTHAKPREPVRIDDWTVAFDPGSNAGSSYVRLTHLQSGQAVAESLGEKAR